MFFGKEFTSTNSDARWFKGQLDDIAIYNRALSPCEIRALYEASSLPYASADTVATCASYQWPITGQTYTQSGTYSDTLASVQGCDSIVSLDLTILEPSSNSITQSACGSYTLNGQTYTQSGAFTQNLTNTAGCDSTLTLNLTVSNLSAGVTFSGGTLTATPAGASYQWVNCENGYQPIAGSTGQSYTPDSTGLYAVVVTSGPCSDTSACTAVTVVGIENTLLQSISVYPNPVGAELKVSGIPAGSTLTLRNALGQQVMTQQAAGENCSMDLSHLPAGMYTLVVEANGKMARVKVAVGR